MTRVVVRDGIDLAGLVAGPAQTWGAVRLVPLLRETPVAGLRLHPRLYDPDALSIVHLGPRTEYIGYVPHAFVATWTDPSGTGPNGTGGVGDGADGDGPTAAYGTQLLDPAAGRPPAGVSLRFRRRMARREDRRRLRFLPLHLALEGYLTLQFGGPAIAWQDWTRQAVTHGLSPRVEAAYAGADIPGLEDALRVFEIHPGQCGMVLYVADALAAAFAVPHPDDYRALHPTLLLDFYGELLHHYALRYPAVPGFTARIDDSRVTDVAGLRAELSRNRAEWASFHAVMAAGLLAAPGLRFSPVYRMGPFTLSRFLPDFGRSGEQHIGETITDAGGCLAYLKTFRLSVAQGRRGYLLSQLAAHDWNLDDAASALGTDRRGLTARLDHAGFGHLLRPEIIDAYRASAHHKR